MKSNRLASLGLVVVLLVWLGVMALYSWKHIAPHLSSTFPALTAIAPSLQPTRTENAPLEIFFTEQSGPVPVNKPVALSGKTRQEIFDLRTQYVNTSIFQIPNYKPSQAVYGQIVDGKPWIALTACWWPMGSPLPTEGPSEESRFIANPSILIGVEQNLVGVSDKKPSAFTQHYGKNFCTSPTTNFIPKRVFYDAQAKEITVVYPKQKVYVPSDHGMYSFEGRNARDLGFSYAYLDLSRSRMKIEFVQRANISNQVYELRNFIHLGNSCKVAGGCNNGSPKQPELDFNSRFNKETSPSLYFKLWRNKPNSPEDPADIAERIIFE